MVLVVLLGSLAVLVGAGELGLGPVVITHPDEQKIIMRLGDPRSVTEPGWALRVPLLDDVRSFDRRLLYLNTEPLPIQTKDEERIVVDNYVVWRIAMPVKFLESFPAGMTQAEDQIDRLVRADVREVIGRHTLSQVLTAEREAIVTAIAEKSDRQLADFGIEVVDVRINRTELPATTEQNVYARMETERQRLARKYRAEGEERARSIRARADRQARVIVATASSQAEIERGRGDADAARIYAAAHSRFPDFYAFVRSLEAYRKTIGKGTTLVLSPRAEFFQFLDGSRVGSGAGDAGAR